MEKVLFICASPRKNGNTTQVLSKCAETIEKHGLKTRSFIYEIKILNPVMHAVNVQKSRNVR